MTLRWTFNLSPNTNYQHQMLLDLDARVTALEARHQQRLSVPGPYRAAMQMMQHLQARKLMLAQKAMMLAQRRGSER
jgi:hypothetical protein